jgi:hypothetical protein
MGANALFSNRYLGCLVVHELEFVLTLLALGEIRGIVLIMFRFWGLRCALFVVIGRPCRDLNLN